MTYINTETYWEEMSTIASEVLSEIETAFDENGEDEINTYYGTIYNDDEECELYIRNKNGEERPLREEETHTILCIADELNEYFANKGED